jgi:hypothetical protein
MLGEHNDFMIKHKIILELEPTYKTEIPHCVVWLNEEEIINQNLKKLIKIEKILDKLNNNILSIRIKRSGRNKFVVKNEPEQNIKINKISINGISINPSIGSFKTIDNLYVNNDLVYTTNLNLNGVYELKIPLLTLQGEKNSIIIKSMNKLKKKESKAHVVFFGASMTNWNFLKGIPPIKNKNNFADLFIKKYKNMNIYNFGFSGSTNQEILENVKYFLQNNYSKVIFIQLVNCLVRQIKNSKTGKIYRWSLHLENSKEDDFIDEFTGITPKNILDYFVYLDVIPLLSLQIPYIRELLENIEKQDIKVYLISHFKEEYDVYKNVFPNNVAPYFNIDSETKYSKDNGYHANPTEHEEFFKSLVNFYEKEVVKNVKV